LQPVIEMTSALSRGGRKPKLTVRQIAEAKARRQAGEALAEIREELNRAMKKGAAFTMVKFDNACRFTPSLA
jgi:hypothetical protein